MNWKTIFFSIVGLIGVGSNVFGSNEYGIIEGTLWLILAELTLLTESGGKK